MNKTFLYIVFCWLCAPLFAQTIPESENLVPNGSFEEYNWCPYQDVQGGVDAFYITACKYWTMPTQGSSDYFNACSTQYDYMLDRYLFSVPENYIGYQYARTGNAYAGLAYTDMYYPLETDNTYSEYIQVQLKEKLEKNKSYNLTFYISNAFDNVCGNSIGAYFSPIELDINTENHLDVTPHYQSDLNFFFCDSVEWFKHEYKFIADGTEEYLIIGVFTHLLESQTSDYFGNIISGPNKDDYGAVAYYYIDDVSLVETNYIIPNVFTPNDDGVNDLFTLRGIPEEFNFVILNRWGNVVFETNNPNQEFWDGTHKGEKCTDGVYFYKLVKDDFKKNGFIHLIR